MQTPQSRNSATRSSERCVRPSFACTVNSRILVCLTLVPACNPPCPKVRYTPPETARARSRSCSSPTASRQCVGPVFRIQPTGTRANGRSCRTSPRLQAYPHARGAIHSYLRPSSTHHTAPGRREHPAFSSFLFRQVLAPRCPKAVSALGRESLRASKGTVASLPCARGAQARGLAAEFSGMGVWGAVWRGDAD